MSEKERGGFLKRVFGLQSSKEKKAQKAQKEQAIQEALALEQEAKSAQSAQRAQAAQDAQEALKRQREQNAAKRSGAQSAQGAQADQDSLKRQIAQGAIRRTTTQPEQSGTRRTRAQDAKDPEAARRQMEQDAIKRYGAQASQVDQNALRRQIEQGAIRRQLDTGAMRRQAPQPTQAGQGTQAAKEPQGSRASQGSEGFSRLGRFGRLGPAGCWVAHKGLETWARLARDKNRGTSNSENESKDARDVTISSVQETVQPSSSMRPHGVSPNLPRGRYELPHRGRSYSSGRPFARSNHTSSISSRGSMDSSSAKQGRNYSDGRGAPLLDQASGYSLRSSSPLRAPSLDGRWDIRGQSSSQGSLSSSSSLAPGSPRMYPIRRGVSTDSHGLPSSPLGAIRPDLYTQRDTPLFLPLTGTGQSLARLHIRLRYDFDRSDLNVHIIEVHDLPCGEAGFSDPYIRMEIHPNVDTKKRETAPVKNKGNPYFNEHFKFPIAHDDLQDRTLVFQLLDFDRFSRLDIIGEVRIEMCEIELISCLEIWAEVGKARKPSEEYQELLVSLSYLPSAQRLTIVVLKARNLFINPNKGTVDPFVKIYLIAEGKRTKKRRTHTKKGDRNPIWNEAFTFNVTSKTLSKAAMELCVFDQSYELIANNPLVGCCLLGNSEEGLEREHWVEVTGSPRKTVAMWHKLR